MAIILDQITVGDHLVFSLDADPRAGAGTPAIVGTIAMVDVGDAGTTGEAYLKVGAADTAWRLISTSATSNVPVEDGSFRYFALYKVDPVGDTLNDGFDESGGGEVTVFVEAQAARALDIAYRVPNPGNSITAADFVLTEGNQTINGDKTFNDNVNINGNLDVNGTLTTIDTVNLQVTDKLITLNRGGAAASAGGSGVELEENALITGYLKISPDREQWCMKAPALDYEACLDLDKLTTDRVYHFPDASGTFLLQPTTPTGVANQIAWWLNGTTITAETGVGSNALTWDDANNFLGIQTAAPQTILQLFNQSSSGSVAADSVILGKQDAVADVGSGALLAGGSAGENEASGADSFVHGHGSIASGNDSSAQGSGVTASGDQSHAEGFNTLASGDQSHAEGFNTLASGIASHAEGSGTTATASGSHAEGTSSDATAANAHAEGLNTTASGASSHAEGDGTTASGAQSHAEGNATVAQGNNSHAEGLNSSATAAQAHAEGNATTASGLNSHAEGDSTEASGADSHAEGEGTEASGDQSHAEGLNSTASGLASHAQGSSTASGDYSHSGGLSSVAAGAYSTAQGRKAQTGANAGAMSLSDSQDFTSTVDAPDRMKMRYQNGWDFVKGGGADDDDGVNFLMRQASVDTTDATLTAVQTIDIPTNTTVLIKSKIVGARTGGSSGSAGDSAAYERTTMYKNVNGTVTKHKTQSDYTYEDQASWTANHSISGTSAVVEVRGAANNDVRWHVTSHIQIVKHT